MHTFLLKPTLTQECRHLDTRYSWLSWSTHITTLTPCQSQLYAHVPVSHLLTTLSEIVAHQTLPWMINYCTQGMPGKSTTGHSHQLIFLKDKSAPMVLPLPTTGLSLHLPAQSNYRLSELSMMDGCGSGFMHFLEFGPALHLKVSCQANWLTTRPIKMPDILNNGSFVKESTEGLFYQEPV